MYGAAAAWRRARYTRHSGRQLRLSRPVISIGNLSVGGSGKTPIVEYIARLLLAAGERPAILSRGYGRRRRSSGATIVSDGNTLRADVDSSGDEPMMLARALPGVAVVVGASRYADGRVAETELGATVHILDDGFQHLQLARDIDLLLVSENDLSDRPLPEGRLREPLAAAAAADAVLVNAGYPTAVDRIARALGVSTSFQMTHTLGAPHTVGPTPDTVVVPPESRVFVVAGIARPERFFGDVESAGWNVVGTLAFRDHYRYRQSDIAKIGAAARGAAAAIVLTTEKDAVRMERCDLNSVPIAAVPLVVGIEPADAFRAWLLARLAQLDPQSRTP
jgi:tetraacyldisaccharide 4'-kinase